MLFIRKKPIISYPLSAIYLSAGNSSHLNYIQFVNTSIRRLDCFRSVFGPTPPIVKIINFVTHTIFL
jgi:hypothetical protein